MLKRTCDRGATPELPQKKLKIADGQENIVSTESTPAGESSLPGENTQWAMKVAAFTSGVGGGIHSVLVTTNLLPTMQVKTATGILNFWETANLNLK